MTVNVAVSEPPEIAVILRWVAAPTPSDITENVGEDAIARTVALAKTVAEMVSLLDSATT